MRSALEQLLPPSLLSDRAATVAALWQAVLWRTNFTPGVRHRLGWRGLRGCAADPTAVTLRVEGMAGVYGLLPGSVHSHLEGAEAELHLYYFPAAEEELVEAYSMQAGIISQQQDYHNRLREFAGDAELCRLFALARLTVGYAATDAGVQLALAAPQRSRIKARDGVTVICDEGPRQLVPPGGLDQDLPAWALALPVLRALAASFSHVLGQGPTALWRYSRPGSLLVYGGEGQAHSEISTELRETRLRLGWGAVEETAMVPEETLELAWYAPEPRPAAYAHEGWWSAQISGTASRSDRKVVDRHDKPRLIVLTGFLGAGKTSFLTRFIEYQAARNSFVAVVQNEIGTKGLDARLLGQNYAVAEIDEGCVCCTLAGSLKLALGDILRQFQPDFIVLETTGLANPAHLLTEIEELGDRLEFGSITTMVDAVLGSEALKRHPVARAQVLLADVLVLNKVERVTAAQRADLEAQLRRLNPSAPIHNCSWGDVSPAALYGVNFRASLRAPTAATATECHSTHRDQGLSSLLLTLSRPLDRQAFLQGLEPLLSPLLRIKGVVELTGVEGSQVYQYVPGSHSFESAGTADRGDRFLVFIGSELLRLEPALRQLVGAG